MSVKVTALGGGHGLAATLRALRACDLDITAIVTVADNGGSSGRLRDEFNSLPPGDLRMALAALCGDDAWGKSWAELMQYRFTSAGEMDGHALGNLLLTALWDREPDPVKGLDRVGELLKVVGRVLPMALEPLEIEADFADGKRIRGQVEVGSHRGDLVDIRITPEEPKTTPEAVLAIEEAAWITLGPGSWFSSVMPHLLVREQRESIIKSSAKKMVLLNLDDPAGDELAGRSPMHHLEVIARFAPELALDLVIADNSLSRYERELQQKADSMGARLLMWDLAHTETTNYHDSEKLTLAFRHIFDQERVR
jgi:uncharacterized cofD-like protein